MLIFEEIAPPAKVFHTFSDGRGRNVEAQDSDLSIPGRWPFMEILSLSISLSLSPGNGLLHEILQLEVIGCETKYIDFLRFANLFITGHRCKKMCKMGNFARTC